MRIPADEDRDADLVISWAATYITQLQQRIEELEREYEQFRSVYPERIAIWNRLRARIDELEHELNDARSGTLPV
jgi:chromosome segregation ATPase